MLTVPSVDYLWLYLGFPGSSEDSACNAGTLVWSLGWEDPLEKEMAIRSSILAKNPVDRGAWWATAHGVAKGRTGLSD